MLCAAWTSLHRIEGRSPTGPLLSDNQAYGDVDGMLSGAALGPADTPLAAQLQATAQSVELHLGATRDVGLVATLRGQDSSPLKDLGRALGGALAAARTKAVLTGDSEAAGLLEYAQVFPGRRHPPTGDGRPLGGARVHARLLQWASSTGRRTLTRQGAVWSVVTTAHKKR